MILNAVTSMSCSYLAVFAVAVPYIPGLLLRWLGDDLSKFLCYSIRKTTICPERVGNIDDCMKTLGHKILYSGLWWLSHCYWSSWNVMHSLNHMPIIMASLKSSSNNIQTVIWDRVKAAQQLTHIIHLHSAHQGTNCHAWERKSYCKRDVLPTRSPMQVYECTGIKLEWWESWKGCEDDFKLKFETLRLRSYESTYNGWWYLVSLEST